MFNTARYLRAAQRRKYYRAGIKNQNPVYASANGHKPVSVEALKWKLGQLTETEWNDYRWFGKPSRLKDQVH